MGKDSKISWTDHTFNPFIGCSKVSDGCKFCYAEEMMDTRFGKVKWGVNGTRVRTSPAYWLQPYAWNLNAKKSGTRQRVFCASLADVFEDRPELEPWRVDLLRMIEQTPHLDWMLLTKRPENVMRMIELAQDQGGAVPGAAVWLLRNPHVWIGTSVEDQENANKRIPELLRIPARVRFLSCEPLLGPVDLSWYLHQFQPGDANCGLERQCSVPTPNGLRQCGYWPEHHGINWIIAGGESGNKARPMHPQWARSLRDQCQNAGVPFHFKQWGQWIPETQLATLLDGVEWIASLDWFNTVYQPGVQWGCLDIEGKYLPETTTWNGRQEDPRDGYEVIIYSIGKKAAGHLLDGVEWHEYPEDAAIESVDVQT